MNKTILGTKDIRLLKDIVKQQIPERVNCRYTELAKTVIKNMLPNNVDIETNWPNTLPFKKIIKRNKISGVDIYGNVLIKKVLVKKSSKYDNNN